MLIYQKGNVILGKLVMRFKFISVTFTEFCKFMNIEIDLIDDYI